MTRVLALLVAAGVLTCALEPATVRAAAGEGQDLKGKVCRMEQQWRTALQLTNRARRLGII
jgi:hypothetical protein